MENIATRSTQPLIISLVSFCLGILLLFLTFLNNYLILLSCVVLIFSIIKLVSYLKTKKFPLQIKDQKLMINNKHIIEKSAIKEVTFKKESSRDFQYNWGKVNIKTATDNYVVKNISNCEKVADLISNLFEKN